MVICKIDNYRLFCTVIQNKKIFIVPSMNFHGWDDSFFYLSLFFKGRLASRITRYADAASRIPSEILASEASTVAKIVDTRTPPTLQLLLR